MKLFEIKLIHNWRISLQTIFFCYQLYVPALDMSNLAEYQNYKESSSELPITII